MVAAGFEQQRDDYYSVRTAKKSSTAAHFSSNKRMQDCFKFSSRFVIGKYELPHFFPVETHPHPLCIFHQKLAEWPELQHLATG